MASGLALINSVHSRTTKECPSCVGPGWGGGGQTTRWDGQALSWQRAGGEKPKDQASSMSTEGGIYNSREESGRRYWDEIKRRNNIANNGYTHGLDYKSSRGRGYETVNSYPQTRRAYDPGYIDYTDHRRDSQIKGPQGYDKSYFNYKATNEQGRVPYGALADRNGYLVPGNNYNGYNNGYNPAGYRSYSQEVRSNSYDRNYPSKNNDYISVPGYTQNNRPPLSYIRSNDEIKKASKRVKKEDVFEDITDV